MYIIMNFESQKIWMRQWQLAGPALEAQRSCELANLSNEERILILNRIPSMSA